MANPFSNLSTEELKQFLAVLEDQPIFKKMFGVSRALIVSCLAMFIAIAGPIYLKIESPQTISEHLLCVFVMFVSAVCFVEGFGYLYHRFVQHLGFLTKLGYLLTHNQKYHWMHHMVIYPIGPSYAHKGAYHCEEKLGLSWYLPAALFAVGYLCFQGVCFNSLMFLLGIFMYAQGVVNGVHEYFHIKDENILQTRAATRGLYQWISDIHLLHHWDQAKNFTIVFPLMDILAGTYLSPAKCQKELTLAKTKHQLTLSDTVNWKYLLLQARPAQKAVFIADVKKRPQYARIKLESFSALLEEIAMRFGESPKIAKLKANTIEFTQIMEAAFSSLPNGRICEAELA